MVEIKKIDKIDMDNGNFPYAKDVGRVLSKTILNSSQRAIISAVFDKTFGWHDKKSEKDKKLKKRHIKAEIDFNFFEEFTGISQSHISDTIKELMKYNILKKEEKGKKSIYSFNINVKEWDRKIFRKKFQNLGWGRKSIYDSSDSDNLIDDEDSSLDREPIVVPIGNSNFPNQGTKYPNQGTKYPNQGTKSADKASNNNNFQTSKETIKETIKEKKGDSSFFSPKKSKKKQKKSNVNCSDFNFLALDISKNLALKILMSDGGKARFRNYGKKVEEEVNAKYANWCLLFHQLIEDEMNTSLEYYTEVMDWVLKENNFWFNPVTQGQANIFCKKFGIMRDQMEGEMRMKLYKRGNFYNGDKIGELTRDEIEDPVPHIGFIQEFINEPYRLSWFGKPQVTEGYLQEIKGKLGDKFEEWYEKWKDRIGEHDINKV